MRIAPSHRMYRSKRHSAASVEMSRHARLIGCDDVTEMATEFPPRRRRCAILSSNSDSGRTDRRARSQSVVLEGEARSDWRRRGWVGRLGEMRKKSVRVRSSGQLLASDSRSSGNRCSARLVIRTLIMSPICDAFASTFTGCHARRPADELAPACGPASPGEVDLPTTGLAKPRLLLYEQACNIPNAWALHVLGNLFLELGARRSGTSSILKTRKLCIVHFSTGRRVSRILIGLAGKADDEIARKRRSAGAARMRSTSASIRQAVWRRFIASGYGRSRLDGRCR